MRGSVELVLTVQLGGGRPSAWQTKLTFDDAEPSEEIRRGLGEAFGQVRSKVVDLLGPSIMEKKP